MVDAADKRLAAALQNNAQATSLALGRALNLSASQIGRRRQRLEETGVIRGYTARLDPKKFGLEIQAFVQVQMGHHGKRHGEAFTRLIARQPEIVSAWTMTGSADYLLRVFCTDLTALNNLIQTVLLAHEAVAHVHSQVVLDQTKIDAALPL